MTFAILASLTVAGDLTGMLDAYLTRIAERYLAEREAKVRAMTTADDVRRRQEHIRSSITASLGGWPEKTPLHPVITGTLERDGYRVEKLIFESLPGFKVTANVYVPSGRGSFPAVLGVAGHSVTGKAENLYQRGWIGMAKRGMLVLAYDPPGQGERSMYWDRAEGKSRVGIGTSEHMMAGLQCTLTGTNIARYEIWDGIRAVDYLLTRSDVDPARIAVAGNSGGGTQSAYLAALEPRLAAAAPSCYITSWRSMWMKLGPQDSEQNFFGFLRDGLDFPDFLIAFAPKPIKMMTAIRDFFPIEGARATFREAQDVFLTLDAGVKVDMFEYDDGHGWSKPRREATYRWFEKWLKGRDDEGAEPDFPIEPAAALQATATGQLATSGGSETVQSLNARLAEKMHASRAAARGGDLVSLVTARLALDRPAGAVKARKMGEVGREGYRIERILLETELGVYVPGLLFVPARPSVPGEVTLFLDNRGKAAEAEEGGELDRRVKAGEALFAIDVRGWGESGLATAKRGGYGPPYQTAMRAYLVGKSIVGLQTVDVLRAAEFLRTRYERVSIAARDIAAAVALYAGVLDPAISRVSVSGRLPSYLEIAQMPEHSGFLELFVHGVLADFDFPDLTKHLGDRYAKAD